MPLRIHRRLLVWVIGLSLTPVVSPAAPVRQTAEEYELKAAYMARFVPFVEWPEDAFASTTSPLTVVVFGTDPFGQHLENSFLGRQVGGRDLAIGSWDEGMPTQSLHILFVPENESLTEAERERLATLPVLIVTETDETDAKGIINYFLEDRRLRFEVDRDAAQRAGIRLGSQLLGLARLVNE